MFYKFENGQLMKGLSVYAPTFTLLAEEKDTYELPIDGWYWFDTDEQAQVLLMNLNPKQQLEYDLRQFASQRDIDIQEIPMLLNSSVPEWKAEAEHFQALYLASWQAFYNNEPLPELVW